MKMETSNGPMYGTVYGQCRCCLQKGYHKNIMKEYQRNGVREIYYNIFTECFNLFLSTNSKISMLICTSCIQRLRDANDFKTQVTDAERKLLSTLAGSNIGETLFVTVPSLEENEIEIKQENEITVKQEDDDGSVLDIEPHFIDDEEPLGKLNSNQPLSKDSDVDREAQLLARFKPEELNPLPTSLYAVYPAFARQLDRLRGETVTSKMIEKLLEDAEYLKKSPNPTRLFVSEKKALINNAANLIQYSNATPFRNKSRSGYPCLYCRETFEIFSDLRKHQDKHKNKDVKKTLSRYGSEGFAVYVDVTDLKCTICEKDISNWNELQPHLIKYHDKKFFSGFTERVIPYKITDGVVYECQICKFSFETFGSLERHMNIHYRNYICKDCGLGYVTKYRLKVHAKGLHAIGDFPCEICKKVFSTQQKHKNHVDTVHKLVKRFKCLKCPEKFTEYFTRQKHMVSVHGVAPLQYKCNVCEKSFDRRYTLSRHIKRDHFEERDFQCDMCTYRCFTKNELRVHMIKHNGERIHECTVCKKSYARKKTLKEHMRIHNNDRRFSCEICGQAFVQKCSLKGHMKTHHVEYTGMQ